MKTLFKSPTRSRAENMLDDIKRQRAEIESKQWGVMHNFEKASELYYEERKLGIEANVLRKLLRK